MTRAARREARFGFVRDAGGVLIACGFVVLAEFVVVGVTCRALFAGNWELVLGRKLVGPIALAMLSPLALALVTLGHVAARAGESTRARGALALVGAALMGTLATLVSGGRHFADPAVRIPFVLALALGTAVAVQTFTPRVVASLDGARRPWVVVVSLVGAASWWLIDARVLVRLYPAFHTAAFVLVFAFASLLVLAWRTPGPVVPRSELWIGCAGLVFATCACLWAPVAARRLERSDNLRLVLEEHAPILGRAVRVAAWLAPPAAIDVGDAPTTAASEVPRALDWSGNDILLVSVDALRADHLGAYGYSRATTPNLDALAKRSALFEHAYCPTPHTSYSVTSMMTGKAMRPLLALGLGNGSDTWATYLRRYGYKTAAFYPPAVFYIDRERFTDLEESGLGFEYRWVEFTSAEAKVEKVASYLATAGAAPLFLWVHLFEPHEPYVEHPGYDFGSDEARHPVDAYDSEIAYTDAAIGKLLAVVSAQRRGHALSVVVTADHGEEFGEHGGRYHGTTCYEEQVRVPLLVSGPGVVPRHVPTVVQTIDLLPTVLSALGIPRPARVRGRDLGQVLAAVDARGANDKPPANGPGLAYVETDEQTMLARGDARLLCARKIAACALYDIRKDPLERHDVSAESSESRELRAMTAAIERDQGRYEASELAWPDALRRGLQGDADAAEDVAALLDDANVQIRRKAAEVTFRLAAHEALPAARRAFERDEDDEVRRWASLAVVRMGEHGSAAERAAALVGDPDVRWRRAASLAFAMAGDDRGKTELAAWWRDAAPGAGTSNMIDDAEAKELLRALARIRDIDVVPALARSLGYVPLREQVADTLGQIGDPRAREPLLALFEHERYETARPFEARALAALGARRELLPPLALFAGLPDPMMEAVSIAADANLLQSAVGGFVSDPPQSDVETHVTVPGAGPLRVWILSTSPGGQITGTFEGESLPALTTVGATQFVDVLGKGDAASLAAMHHGAEITVHDTAGVRALWLVARRSAPPAFLLPPPPDAGTP